MATQAQIKLTISKLSTAAIEKRIAEGKYNEEELKVANEIVSARNANKGKAEAEKAKGTAKKVAKKEPTPETTATTTEEAPAKEPKKKATPKAKKADPGDTIEGGEAPVTKTPKEPKPKKEPKPRKEGHGDIRAAIKEQLLQLVAPAQVRSIVKEKLDLKREVHYSEVKSVLDRLKADEQTGAEFTAKWEEKFKKEPAAPKDATPKKKDKKKATEEEVVTEPTAEELAQLAETEAENAETSATEEQVGEAA